MRFLEEQVRKRFGVLLVALVTLAVWGHTVGFGFVWDDEFFVWRNQSIRSLTNIPRMFSSLDAQSAKAADFRVFRPLRNVGYAVLYAIPGRLEPQPWIFHLANVLWQVVAGVLLYDVAGRMFRRGKPEEQPASSWPALLIALAFAVNPVISEVVCWVKCQDDIMAAVFVLASLREVLKWENRRRNYTLALIYFLLAVYSKESAVPFALLVFFIFKKFHRLSLRENLKLTAGFLLLAVIYMTHRHLVLGRSSQVAPISGSYGRTLIDMFPVVPEYVRLLCGIPPFCIDYSFMQGHLPFLSLAVLTGGLSLALLFFLAILAWRSGRFWLAGFGLLWVAAFLLPVSNLLPMMQYMAERFLYLPLIGWLVALAAALSCLPDRRWAPAVFALLIAVWIPLSWQRSFIWRDGLTLFVQTSQECPGVNRVEKNAVAAVFALPQMEEVFDVNPREIQFHLKPEFSEPAGRRALATLEKARQWFPGNADVWTSMGTIYARMGEPRQAMPFFERAARISPENPDNWINLALAAMEIKDWPAASNAVTRVLSLDTHNANALHCATAFYWQTENYRAALDCLKQLKQIEPENPDNELWMKKAAGKIQEAGEQKH
jgi:protein O-mannosyl-transferase